MSVPFHHDLTAVASLLRSQCCLSPYYWQSLLGNANAPSHQFCLTSTGHLATANGAVALLDNFPSMDATEVAQAKAYGAIILAHGNMAEWAFTNAISIGSGMHLTPANAEVHSLCNTWAIQLWLLGDHWGYAMQSLLPLSPLVCCFCPSICCTTGHIVSASS